MSFTEVDLDNIEEFLSLIDLMPLLLPADRAGETVKAPSQVRELIEIVIARSTSLPVPESPSWLEMFGRIQQYKDLLWACYTSLSDVTLVTLNYDCVLEYCCYCLGIPFRYGSGQGKQLYEGERRGLRILKLHGSVNWLKCENRECLEFGAGRVAPIRHFPGSPGQPDGYVGLEADVCSACGSRQSAVLVPPTWAKKYDDPMLKGAWCDAYDALSLADVLVVAGYSLPIADSAVRNMLHLGLSRSDVREAAIIVGSDISASDRWSNLFRRSWRDNRLRIESRPLSDSVRSIVWPLLGCDEGWYGPRTAIPPIPRTAQDLAARDGVGTKLAAATERSLDSMWRGVDWLTVLADARRGGSGENIEAASNAGLDWRPAGPILPVV